MSENLTRQHCRIHDSVVSTLTSYDEYIFLLQPFNKTDLSISSPSVSNQVAKFLEDRLLFGENRV